MNTLVSQKQLLNHQIEYTQRILHSSQLGKQKSRSALRNKRTSYGCYQNQHFIETEDSMKLCPQKTYVFEKTQTVQQQKRQQSNQQHQKLMGNKSSGFVPPSLREMLRPKGGTNLQNINSLRSSKNTSM